MSSKEKDSCHKRNKDRRQTEVKSRSPKTSTTTEPVNDDGKTRQDAAERQKQEQGKPGSSKPPHHRSRCRPQERNKLGSISTLQTTKEQTSVKMQGHPSSLLDVAGHTSIWNVPKRTTDKEKTTRSKTPAGVKTTKCQGSEKTDWRAGNVTNSQTKWKAQSHPRASNGRRENVKKNGSSENYSHDSFVKKANNEQRRRNDREYILTKTYISHLITSCPIESFKKLNQNLNGLENLLNSSSGQMIEDKFLKELLLVLANCCDVSSTENLNPLLTVLKNSLFFSNHIKAYLQLIQSNDSKVTETDHTMGIADMIRVFSAYLRHFPSSYSDIPLEMLQRTIEMMQVEKKIELQNSLALLKTERDEVIKAERRRFAKPFQKQETKQMKPPDNYREIQICPTLKELSSNEKPFLRKNIKKGKYEDGEHYLDVQFRLYREDFIAPLREGIQEVVNKVSRRDRNQNIKLYHNVRIKGKEFTKSGIVYKVAFDPTRFRFTNWNHSKRLIFGSFLCLSRDEFKTMLFGTVANRDPEDLKKGRFDIHFVRGQEVVGIEKRNECFIIAESPAYFEAYRHVLVGMQGLTEDNLPFKKYLVECSPDVDSPLYLRRYEEQDLVTYNLREVFNNQSVPPVKVLVANDWPQAETLPLNASQLEAFQTAITKEFTVIQGPPGTGKTYVGLKIVQALLRNRRVWDPRRVSPMLMVCFTNHALDQFLEGVREFLPNGIIRVGGRCKSEDLQIFNLRRFVNHDPRRNFIYSLMKAWEIYIQQAKAFSEVRNNANLAFDLHLEEVIENRFLDQLYYHPNLFESNTVSDLFKAWVLNKFPAKKTQRREKYCITTLQETNQVPGTECLHDTPIKQADNRKLSRTPEQKDNQEQAKFDTSASKRDAMENQVHFTTDRFVSSVQKGDDAVKNDKGPGKKDENIVEVNHYYNTIIQRGDEKKQEVLWNSEGYETFATSNTVKANCTSYVNRTPQERKVQSGESCSTTVYTSNGIEEEANHDQIKGDTKSALDIAEDNADYNENRPADENSKTINVDHEVDLIQSQRYEEGEEDMFSPIRNVSESALHQDKNTLVKEDDKVVPNDEATRNAPNGEDDNEMWTRQQDRHCKQPSNVRICKEDIQRVNTLLLQGKGFQQEEVARIENMWMLSDSERIRLYLYWLNCFRQRWRLAAGRAEETYDILCNDLDRMKAEEDERSLRKATVIGMTTSCAARYHSVLQQIRPKIVVIEEAAEVLEAHILTSLTQDTEHVILIGDHKQLRPKPTVYQLAQKFNLEISLFERMVLNKMDCKQLSIQHRMRPEIARLTKRIYDHEIIDNDRVKSYPDIRGMQKNMYFVDHTEPENFQEGLQSYSNKHEANFVAALCWYLLQQGYERSQITILTMYTGQMLDIKKIMPLSQFNGVRLSAVDNFQGEENDIVILSLVRSNRQESVGFLREPNRICVSLSRARMGFYVIGNFKLLCSQSSLWKEICKDLESEGQLGNTMPLICEKHGNVTDVKTAEDFKKVPEGGCNEPCEDRLKCGHVCVRRCHAGDPEHIRYKCRKKCLEKCPEGHPCKETCHLGRECDQCWVEVTKTFPDCKHDIETACGDDIQSLRCIEQCERTLECGHQCSRPCFARCNVKSCNVIVKKTLLCHHVKGIPCSKDPLCERCSEKCTKLLDCQHECPGKCHESCEKQVCKKKIEKLLSCGHKAMVLCSERNNAVECHEPCNKKLLCSHNCPNKCHEACPHDRCNVRVLNILPCSHKRKMECHRSPSDVFCNSICERKLPCGHPCLQLCGNVCQRTTCSKVVDNTLPCGHLQAVRCGDYPNFVCKASCNKVVCNREHRCKKKCHFEKQPCGRCTMLIKVEMPECKHEVLAECWKEPSAIHCSQPCERTLACGHRCKLKCGENCGTSVCKENMTKKLQCGHTKDLPCFQDETHYKCAAKVKKKLPCGHEKKCSCHQKPEEVMCNVSVTTTLDTCGHTKHLQCCEAKRVQEGKVAAVYCAAVVSKTLPCGHEMEIACGEDPRKTFCQAPCERNLSCRSHRCTKRCGDDCSNSVCKMKCAKRLKCGHRCSGLCGEDCPRCKEKCERLLPCNHSCQGLCGEPCDPSKCIIRVKMQFPCGHKVKKGLPCNVSTNAKCKQKCQRQLSCGHICPGECGFLCDQFQCHVKVPKKLQCDHSVIVKCFQLSEEVECPAPCATKLPCGHVCGGVCGECRENGSHEKCHLPCGRTLVCSHRCRAPCDEPCPPCTRPCQRSCVHGKCRQLCWEDCEPCLLPCALSCPHVQCNNLCNENCDRPFCDESCPKRLRCGHPCIGFCGEMCPTLCRVCNPREIAAIAPKGEQNSNIKFVQLFDCGHVFEASFLDQWMQADPETVGSRQIFLKVCPACSVPVLFSFRYKGAAKRTARNLDAVKMELKEMTAAINAELNYRANVSSALKNLRFPIKPDLRSITRNTNRLFADNLKRNMKYFSYAFLLRNHIAILKLLQETRAKIERIQHMPRRSAYSLSKLYENTASETQELVIELLQAGPVVLVGRIEDILMDPQPDVEVMIKLYRSAVLVSLLVDLIEVKRDVLRKVVTLNSVSDTALNDILNAMVTQTVSLPACKTRSAQLSVLLQWKTAAQLEDEVNQIRQDAGLQPLVVRPTVKLVSFPGLCRENWFSCERGHVFARFEIANVSTRSGSVRTVAECQTCSQELKP